MMRSTAILCFLAFSVTLFAGDGTDLSALKLLETQSFQNKKPSGTGTFVAPNEWNPRRMRTGFETPLTEGAYIGVGTERTYIAAALNPQINLVIQVDQDSQIVLFNRLNTLLLSVANDLRDYQRLRFEFSVQVVAHRIQQYTKSTTGAEQYLLWFLKTARENKGFEAFGQKIALTPFAATHFKEARYTHDRLQFQRLQTLAREGRIISLYGNLGDKDFVQDLNEALIRAQTKISLIDISNAWWSQYMKNKDMQTLLANLISSSTTDTQVLMTSGGGANAKNNWEYMARPAHELLAQAESLQTDEHISTKIHRSFIEARSSCGRFF